MGLAERKAIENRQTVATVAVQLKCTHVGDFAKFAFHLPAILRNCQAPMKPLPGQCESGTDLTFFIPIPVTVVSRPLHGPARQVALVVAPTHVAVAIVRGQLRRSKLSPGDLDAAATVGRCRKASRNRCCFSFDRGVST